jgi:hypothetical protein
MDWKSRCQRDRSNFTSGQGSISKHPIQSCSGKSTGTFLNCLCRVIVLRNVITKVPHPKEHWEIDGTFLKCLCRVIMLISKVPRPKERWEIEWNFLCRVIMKERRVSRRRKRREKIKISMSSHMKRGLTICNVQQFTDHPIAQNARTHTSIRTTRTRTAMHSRVCASHINRECRSPSCSRAGSWVCGLRCTKAASMPSSTCASSSSCRRRLRFGGCFVDKNIPRGVCLFGLKEHSTRLVFGWAGSGQEHSTRCVFVWAGNENTMRVAGLRTACVDSMASFFSHASSVI